MRFLQRRSVMSAAVAATVITVLTSACATSASFDNGRLATGTPSAGDAGAGSLVHVEQLPGSDSRAAVPGERAALISYRSTDARTRASTVVSGTAFVPGGDAPRGGWPVLAFGPDISETDDPCAAGTTPSSLTESTVVQYVSRGFAVTVSGYQRSASPSTPTLLDSGTTGLNIIDSVRALRHAFPDVSTRWAAMGVLQGGAGAWEADSRAADYAPELHLVGAVALSPMADMTGLVTGAQNGTLTQVQARLVQDTLESLGQRQLGLDARRSSVVSQNWSALSSCAGPLVPMVAALAHTEGALDFAPPTSRSTDPLRALLAQQATTGRALSAPLSVVYGSGDTIVDPQWTSDAIRRTCATGSAVTWRLESGTGRSDDDRTGQIDWLTDRFAGRPAGNDCLATSISTAHAGDVVSSETLPSMAALPPGTHAARVLYRSTEGDTGLPTVVSAAVFSPAGTAPVGGWPVIAYGHGTTGIDTECNLSQSNTLAGQISLVSAFLAFGYAVSVPDYQGLGAPGPHPYLDARTAGLNVIDSVRAVRNRFPDISSRWGALGHSQGGAAVWAADEQAGTYAPELDFVGAVALAPAASVTGLVDKSDRGTLTTDQIPALALVLTSLQRLHPDLDLDNYRRGPAAAHWNSLSACAGGLLPERAAALAQIRSQDIAPATPQASDEVHGLLARWALPQRPETAPMSILYGSADQLVDAGWTTDALSRACALGDTLAFHEQAGGTHSDLDLTGQLPWLRDRFAGLAAPNDCP